MQQEVDNNRSDSHQPRQTAPTPTDKPERDIWDYIEILARPVSASITALAVASLGIFANLAISKNNQQATKNAQIEQNTRLYTELLSRREQADSSLRKDMFNTILNQFLAETTSSGSKNEVITDRMLKLELLALNFGEALSLRPLFQEMNRSIESHSSLIEKREGKNSARVFRSLLRPRLDSLARRVSDRQLSSLSAGGKTLVVSIAPTDAGAGIGNENKVYRWQYHEAQSRWDESRDDKGFNPSNLSEEEWIDNEVMLNNTLTVGGITRSYSITLSEANPKTSEVTVDLIIQDLAGPDISPLPVEMKFKLNYFNFPLIDNTRLTGDQRFALVLTKFNKDVISIVGICFPGVYASQRDKPFLNDVIDQLRNKQESDRNELENLPAET